MSRGAVFPPACSSARRRSREFLLDEGHRWYFALLAIDVVVMLFCINLVRSRTGRALMAIRDREFVAEAMGIPVRRYKLTAFVLSSAITAVAGSLIGYYRVFVSMDAFTLNLTMEYVAMVIIGGMGSMLGVVLGALFVVILSRTSSKGLYTSSPSPRAWPTRYLRLTLRRLV